MQQLIEPHKITNFVNSRPMSMTTACLSVSVIVASPFIVTVELARAVDRSVSDIFGTQDKSVL
jgi:hypothetical protein